MEINKVNGFILSRLVSDKFNKKIITTELQFLNEIEKEGKIRKEIFAETYKMPIEIVNRIFTSLARKHLIKPSSPEYVITEGGRMVLNYCKKIYSSVNKEVNNDSRLEEISKVSTF